MFVLSEKFAINNKNFSLKNLCKFYFRLLHKTIMFLIYVNKSLEFA